jgi:ABC-type multidrug transport system ATPase subunit
MSAPWLIQVNHLTCGPIQNLSFAWPSGVGWICGDEGRGKTTLLRLLAGDVHPAAGQVVTPAGGVFWVDLQDATHDDTTVQACWDALRAHYPRWNQDLLQDLAEELGMTQHLDKRLSMLSAGSRRKVMVVAALASGATVTLLDQPFAALDLASVRVIHEFLQEAAEHTSRAWIVADYQAPNDLPLASVLNLDTPR